MPLQIVRNDITNGYDLPCKYVIHAVDPRSYDGQHGDRELLISCYRISLMMAKKPSIAPFGVILGFLFSSIPQPGGNRGYFGV